jgi:hypothetical protein
MTRQVCVDRATRADRDDVNAIATRAIHDTKIANAQTPTTRQLAVKRFTEVRIVGEFLQRRANFSF